MSKKLCLALDLKSDPQLIAAYDAYHQQVWPEILDSLREAGILDMQIYRWENRLCMIIETTDDFSLERKGQLDKANIKVQEWENLMLNYQQALPGVLPGEKWQEMKKVFEL